MDSRDLVRRTLEFSRPVRVPRQTTVRSWADRHEPGAVARLRARYPDDIVTAPALYLEPLRVVGGAWQQGIYVDEWGCRFENRHEGMLGTLTGPLVGAWEDLERFRTPDCVLHVDRAAVNAFCASSGRFVVAPALIRPFERLCAVRTMERALADVLRQPPEFAELLRRIHGHYVREVEAWAATAVDAIEIMDDWGSETRLFVSPETWRRTFRPLYRDYCDIARRAGKFVFMHSDGFILDIIGDLVEVGVRALECQVACMGAVELARRFRGKVAFWGDSDLQALLSSGSEDDVVRRVRETRRELYADGGVIAHCEFGRGTNPANVFALFAAWI